MTDDRDDASEQLDEDVVGQDVGDAEPSGLRDYPRDRPMGVDDPSLAGDDDVATRDLRRHVDDPDTGGATGDEVASGVVLVDPDGGGTLDDEEQEIADAVLDDAGALPAEDAALHIEGEPDRG